MNEAKESTRETPRKAKYNHKLICGYLKRARSCTLWRSLISEPNAPWFVRQRARTIVNFAHDSNALATIVGEENRKMLVGRTLEKGGGTLLPRRQLNKKKKKFLAHRLDKSAVYCATTLGHGRVWNRRYVRGGGWGSCLGR